jgi:hypothetical protein
MNQYTILLVVIIVCAFLAFLSKDGNSFLLIKHCLEKYDPQTCQAVFGG